MIRLLTFVSGGVRSGKSSLAEKLAVDRFISSHTAGLYYVATARVTNDVEMQERIRMHQKGRSSIWTTIEESAHIEQLIDKLPAKSVVLIDCLTVWSSNVLFTENKTYETMINRIEKTVRIAKDKKITVIFVSNDLNEDLPIQDEGVQKYIYSLEAVHKCAVSHSDQAIQGVDGSPIRWK